MEIKIYYQDTDCGGVVYYANYLTYFERARTEWMSEKGLELAELAKKGILFVVAHAEINYRSPARYAEVLKISTEIKEAGLVKLDFLHSVHEKKTGRLICTGSSRLVCVDKDMKPQKIPDEIHKLFA